MKFEFNNVYITGAGGWLGKQLIEVLLSPDSNKAIKFSVSNNLKINAMVLLAKISLICIKNQKT